MKDTKTYFILTVYRTDGTKEERKCDIEEMAWTIKTFQPYFHLNGIEKVVIDSVEPFEGRRRWKTVYANKQA